MVATYNNIYETYIFSSKLQKYLQNTPILLSLKKRINELLGSIYLHRKADSKVPIYII